MYVGCWRSVTVHKATADQWSNEERAAWRHPHLSLKCHMHTIASDITTAIATATGKKKERKKQVEKFRVTGNCFSYYSWIKMKTINRRQPLQCCCYMLLRNSGILVFTWMPTGTKPAEHCCRWSTSPKASTHPSLVPVWGMGSGLSNVWLGFMA